MGFFSLPFSVLVVKKSVLKKLTTVSILLDVYIGRVDVFITYEDLHYTIDKPAKYD